MDLISGLLFSLFSISVPSNGDRHSRGTDLRQFRLKSSSTMPEIAEVERARTILDQILVGQTIIDVESVSSLNNIY